MKMEEWKECKLKDITSLITKGTTPSMIGANFTTNGIKFIKSECILENSRLLDSSKYTFISSETNERLKRSQIIENDILFSMAGMFLGKTGIATEDDVPANTNQAVAIIRIISEKADFKYVYYFLNQKTLITYINGISGQSAQPNINLQQIGDLEIKLPPLPTQQKIAAILSSLDDKIELNNKINNSLEQQAGALFKNWFVDFEPFGGKMPEGWKECKAEEYFEITIGKTPPRKDQEWFSEEKTDQTIKWVSISDMGSCGTFISDSSEYLTTDAVSKFNVKVVPVNTVLLSFKLTVGRIAITDDEMCTNEAIAHFGTKNKAINEYLFLYLKNFNYQTMGSTSSIAIAVNSKIIKGMTFVLPDDETLKNFHEKCSSMFEVIRNNQQENQNLTNLRDTLLPKLMSGEIDVDSVRL